MLFDPSFQSTASPLSVQAAMVKPVAASGPNVHLQLAICASTHAGYCQTSWPKRSSHVSQPGGAGGSGGGPALQMQPVLGSVGSSSSHVELAGAVQLPAHVTFLPAVTALQPPRRRRSSAPARLSGCRRSAPLAAPRSTARAQRRGIPARAAGPQAKAARMVPEAARLVRHGPRYKLAPFSKILSPRTIILVYQPCS
eukprot:SAG22_NODE_1843_length_3455_cov_2.608760_4_plen_197_part_00